MVKFFKYLLATFAGGIVAAFMLFIILFGMLSAMAALGDKETKISEKYNSFAGLKRANC